MSRVVSRVDVMGVAVDGYPTYAPEAVQGRVRDVTVVGEPVLREACRPVTEFGTAELRSLVDDMFRTMYVAHGAGLAANQVGVALRLFVYDCFDDDGVRHVGHLVNPVVDDLPADARSLVAAEEGCLSVPGPVCEVYRPDHAVVRGFSVDGEPVVLEGTGYFARCLLHETDHLAGTLYIDRLSRRARRGVLDEMNSVMDDVFARRESRAVELARELTGHSSAGEPR